MIRTNEICDYLPAGAWRDFRNELTDLDMAIPESERRSEDLSSIVLNHKGTSVSYLNGFVLSSSVANGFIYRAEYDRPPILLFSGVPQDTGEPQRYMLIGDSACCSMYTDEHCESALIWASAVYNQISANRLAEILLDSGITYMPKDLFIEYSDACKNGTELLYGKEGKYPDLCISRINGWLKDMGSTILLVYLTYINTALNHTYQSEEVVRRLAVEHGLIKRA